MVKGYFVDKKGRVLIIEDQQIVDRLGADELVDAANKMIQDYNDDFAKALGKYEYNISDWFKFQEGLLPLIKENADLVHSLHEHGFTNYKINMQSGVISR